MRLSEPKMLVQVRLQASVQRGEVWLHSREAAAALLLRRDSCGGMFPSLCICSAGRGRVAVCTVMKIGWLCGKKSSPKGGCSACCQLQDVMLWAGNSNQAPAVV